MTHVRSRGPWASFAICGAIGLALVTVVSPPVRAESAPCPGPLVVDVAEPYQLHHLSPDASARTWRALFPGEQGWFPVSAVTMASNPPRLTPWMSHVPKTVDPREPLGSKKVAASVNGDYFSYRSTSAALPKSLVAVNGRVLYAPRGWTPAVVLDLTGQPRTTSVTTDGRLSIGHRQWRITSVNDPRRQAGHVALTSDWRGGRVAAGEGNVFLHIRDGFVVGRTAKAPRRIASRGFAVRVTATWAKTIRPGERAFVIIRARAHDGLPVTQASGHGGRILTHGAVRKLCSTYENMRRPRTMFAWDQQGLTWLLTAGTGPVAPGSLVRSGGSTKRQLAEVARRLGATDGVVLDGGGSTALFIRTGRGGIKRIDAQSAVDVRKVPVLWILKVA